MPALPTLRFLNDSEVEAVHQATLRILWEVGIVLTHSEGRERLTAVVHKDRVRIPSDLVDRALAQCPHQVTLRGRGGRCVPLGDGSLPWHNVGGARDVYDPRAGKRRPATVQDVRDSARLLDALESVTTVTLFFSQQSSVVSRQGPVVRGQGGAWGRHCC